jgi:hypothetical protein
MFVFIAALPAFSQTPDAKKLICEMKDIVEPSRTSVRSLDLISTDAKGDTITLSLMQAYKKLPDGKHMIMVMREPRDASGFTYLFTERDNRQLPVYEYLPFLRRVKKTVGMVTSYDNFFTTDFTYADLGFIPVQETCLFLGETQYNGVRAYKTEETMPKDNVYISRIVTWIAYDSKLPLERDLYDTTGRLWKKETFSNVTVVNGLPTPMSITMKDVLNGTMTELKITSIRTDMEIPNEFFLPEHLSKAADAPIWKQLKDTMVK